MVISALSILNPIEITFIQAFSNDQYFYWIKYFEQNSIFLYFINTLHVFYKIKYTFKKKIQKRKKRFLHRKQTGKRGSVISDYIPSTDTVASYILYGTTALKNYRPGFWCLVGQLNVER